MENDSVSNVPAVWTPEACAVSRRLHLTEAERIMVETVARSHDPERVWVLGADVLVIADRRRKEREIALKLCRVAKHVLNAFACHNLCREEDDGVDENDETQFVLVSAGETERLLSEELTAALADGVARYGFIDEELR